MKVNSMIEFLKKYTWLAGFIGCLSSLTGILCSAVVFKGRTQESYSLLNHFISELGNPMFSQNAWLFNIGLIISGTCILLFMNGIAWMLHNKLRYALMLTGTLCGIFAILVGVYPATKELLAIHIKVAAVFFQLSLLGIILFSIITFIENRQDFISKVFSFSGTLPIFCLLAFIMERQKYAGRFTLEGMQQLMMSRGPFWALPFFEWLVYFSMLIWISIISIRLVIVQKRTAL